jgi:membrane-bound lytic murein transglycosylase F
MDNKFISLIRKLFFVNAILSTALISCSDFRSIRSNNNRNCVSIDLDSIRSRGTLIAVTECNSMDYFIYRGEPMGLNYELLKSFSGKIGVDLEIVNENNLEHAYAMLRSGQADLLAIRLSVNSMKGKDILFTVPIDETRQVLIQRKPPDWRSLSWQEMDKKLIKDKSGLAKKAIYLPQGSSHVERLDSLEDEIQDSINIIEVPYDTERLIKQVASGEVEYTVCDENIAIVNSTYFPDIDVSTPLSFPRGVAWAVRKNNSDSLLFELNRWITELKRTESYSLMYSKYFRNSRSYTIYNSKYYALNTGKVSRYDDLIRKFSETIKWDWRLLASLIYQESRFEPKVRSGAGAFGLMQIMPVTGRYFGIDVTASPENNLKAGIKYINWLNSIFNPLISDESERINFILASYNAGPGHVLDAMKLAEKNGMDPQKWKGNVALWILKMSDPHYFNDIEVKYGYFRGNESVNFVNEVLERFKQYKNMIPSEKTYPLEND